MVKITPLLAYTCFMVAYLKLFQGFGMIDTIQSSIPCDTPVDPGGIVFTGSYFCGDPKFVLEEAIRMKYQASMILQWVTMLVSIPWSLTYFLTDQQTFILSLVGDAIPCWLTLLYLFGDVGASYNTVYMAAFVFAGLSPTSVMAFEAMESFGKVCIDGTEFEAAYAQVVGMAVAAGATGGLVFTIASAVPLGLAWTVVSVSCVVCPLLISRLTVTSLPTMMSPEPKPPPPTFCREEVDLIIQDAKMLLKDPKVFHHLVLCGSHGLNGFFSMQILSHMNLMYHDWTLARQFAEIIGRSLAVSFVAWFIGMRIRRYGETAFLRRYVYWAPVIAIVLVALYPMATMVWPPYALTFFFSLNDQILGSLREPCIERSVPKANRAIKPMTCFIGFFCSVMFIGIYSLLFDPNVPPTTLFDMSKPLVLNLALRLIELVYYVVFVWPSDCVTMDDVTAARRRMAGEGRKKAKGSEVDSVEKMQERDRKNGLKTN